MNILIADDEPLIRLSIRHNLEKQPIDRLRVYEAADGMELLRELERLQPDVAIVDIKMPLLGGLEAIEQGRSLSPHTEFIITTGFSEFDYARRAIALRVTEYLLKPVSSEQFGAVLRNVRESLARQSAESNRLFTLHIAETVAAQDSSSAPDDRLPLASLQVKLMAVCFDGSCAAGLSDAEAWLARARTHIEPYLSRHFHMTVVKLRDHERVLVFGVNKQDASRDSALSSCVKELNVLTAAWRKEHGAVTVVTGTTIPAADFGNAYAELTELLCLRALLGVSMHYSQSFLRAVRADKPHYADASALLVDLAHDLYADQPIVAHAKAERLISCIEGVRLYEHPRTIRAIADYLRGVVGLSVAPNASFAALKQELLGWCKSRIGVQTDRGRLIRSLRAYAEAHFMEDISVAKAADRFDLSPNYISTLFHKETGTKFVEYVTRLRMKEAQKLLTETELSVQEITRRIGLYSTSHFSKLFTQYCNASPREYKRSFGAKESE
ncbi:response regulator [Paenibacillus cymbidii]|uniref:response regulator n=1 Tax=Paenibacillus cymbidii TaxID=1639034 RepID=UPI001080B07A|nr:helix-turn-helix domain-containing protein [Paenibacillus cymbidii]